MRIPQSEKSLLKFVREKVEECTYSQSTRAGEAASNLAFYEQGSDSGKPSLYNRTGIHIDRTASYLYAPGEIRYSIGFDATDGDPWLTRARIASKYLSREYRRADADVLFFQGVEMGLVKGCSLLKHGWLEDHTLSPGFNPILVHPEFFGVEREDYQRLEDQQYFCHTFYLSKHEIFQIIEGREDANEIKKMMAKLGQVTTSDDKTNWLHQTVIGGAYSGGQQPVAIGVASGARGQVAISPSSKTQFSPEMLINLMRVDELWVVDSKRDDYTTLQLVEGEFLLEGKYIHRNLTGVKGLHPFSKICADPVAGYFWGRSEVGQVKSIQELLTQRMIEIQRLLKLQVRSPKAFIGFTGLTQQKMRAALSPNGFLQEQNPNAKIEDLGPKIPEELFREVQEFSAMFDEVGGFKPILQGQGEPGVRANAHAKTLMRTASPNLRERALRIERNAESSAAISFKMMQAKDDRVFKSDEEQFFLSQMPADYHIEVDSHTSSPAFSDDARELAFALARIQAIAPDDVIRMTHPPGEEILLESYKKRQAAKAQMIKDHPELLSNKKTGKR